MGAATGLLFGGTPGKEPAVKEKRFLQSEIREGIILPKQIGRSAAGGF
jgi:hypothetical protein